VTGKSEWSRATRDRREALAWRAAAIAISSAEPRRLRQSLTFAEIAERWWDGVERGSIGKRRGTGDPYSETTLQGYGRDLRGILIPEFGSRLAEDVTELEWQTWIDELRDAGLSRSRIANLLAVASAIYGWAARPTRKLVARNPVRLVELPTRDEKPRIRIASVIEAERLLAVLRPDDAVPYAIAMYAGLRRQELQRLRWEDIDTRIMIPLRFGSTALFEGAGGQERGHVCTASGRRGDRSQVRARQQQGTLLSEEWGSA
jgi:integrase